jgi:hypothetical protein
MAYNFPEPSELVVPELIITKLFQFHHFFIFAPNINTRRAGDNGQNDVLHQEGVDMHGSLSCFLIEWLQFILYKTTKEIGQESF